MIYRYFFHIFEDRKIYNYKLNLYHISTIGCELPSDIK